MKNITRHFFNAFVSTIALLNGVPSAAVQFVVEPSVQQRLETKVQESSEFLSKINISPVDELSGERLGLGVGSTIASRTNTAAGNRRNPIDPTGLGSFKYQCVQTNFDTALRYAKLDAWAKFPDFEKRITDAIVKRCALDRMMIGFNGTHAADATDRVAFPLLQDVNKGWLQIIREHAPERVMDEAVLGSGEVTYGSHADADYASLDAMVYDGKEQLLAQHHKEDTELVVIVGSKLLHDKYFPMINKAEAPTEQLARDVIMSTKRLGGLPAIRVPFFPEDAILITRLDNLSIYYQDGKRRRHIKDESEFDRVADYQSSNEAYVIEDFEGVALIENIVLKDAPPAP